MLIFFVHGEFLIQDPVCCFEISSASLFPVQRHNWAALTER
jgi:hypothetical protein